MIDIAQTIEMHQLFNQRRKQNQHHTDSYTTIGWVAVGVGVGLILLSPLIKKLMHLDSLQDVDHSLAGQSELAEPQAAGIDTSKETL